MDYTRHIVIAAFIVIACIGAIISSGVLTAIFYFVLMGSIPGTRLALSPDMMLGISLGILLFLAGHGLVRLISVIKNRKFMRTISKRQAQFPHRRYARKAAQS